MANVFRHPYVMLLVLAVLWSSSFTAIKIGVVSVPPTMLVAGRLVIATLLLLALARMRGRILPPWGREWAIYFALGAAGYSVPFFLISWGEVVVDSGPAAILMAIMPLTTMFLAHLFLGDERMSARKALGMMLGLVGVVVLVGPGTLARLGHDTVRELAIACGAVCYAVNTILSRRLEPVDPVRRSGAVVLCAVVQMVPISLWLDGASVLTVPLSAGLAMLYLGVFPTAAAAVVFFKLIDTQGPTFVSLNNYIIPCLGVLWGVLLLGENISPQAILALGIILGGIAIARSDHGRLKTQRVGK